MIGGGGVALFADGSVGGEVGEVSELRLWSD